MTVTAGDKRKPADRAGLKPNARGVAKCGVKQSVSEDRQSIVHVREHH